MKRKIFAQIEVDDDTAFQTIDDGPIPYLEEQMKLLKQSRIFLKEAFITDEDEDDEEYAYLNYLAESIFDCLDNESCINGIVGFREWKRQKFQHRKE